MDVIELCKKSVALANRDKEFLKKIKKIRVSISIKFRDKLKENFSILVKGGKIKVGKVIKPDFEITTTTEDFYDVMSGKTPGLIAMALEKIKITKGDMVELNKLAPILMGLIKYSKKVLEGEK